MGTVAAAHLYKGMVGLVGLRSEQRHSHAQRKNPSQLKNAPSRQGTDRTVRREAFSLSRQLKCTRTNTGDAWVWACT